ncbi:MAG: hypothetical protein H0T42_21690 [Deltaproteobacteria bacterium]|nr:hypothetical protein [Deltaproteobacteria bacterium]
MPAPQADAMKNFARLKFMSFNLKVPTNWRNPQGDAGAMYDGAFKDNEKTSTPGSPPLFQPASLNKYDTDVQKMQIATVGGFIDSISSAICDAWGKWQNLATMAGVVIIGPVATMGQLIGPPLTPLILASAPKSSPQQLKYANAVATVIGTAWLAYTATIKLPGLPIYPAFAACPSPVAPPIPNTPFPIAGAMQVTASLTPALMKMQMQAMLGDPTAPFHGELFEAICDGFDKCFKIWQTTTMVTNIIGTGAVPSMALVPPVPGPVTGGIGTMAPGGLK